MSWFKANVSICLPYHTINLTGWKVGGIKYEYGCMNPRIFKQLFTVKKKISADGFAWTNKAISYYKT